MIDEPLIQTEEDEERAREQQLTRLQELGDIKDILLTIQGQRFFRRLFSDGAIFHSTFDQNHANASFKEGFRALALKYFSEALQASPESLPKLMGIDEGSDTTQE